MIRPLEERQGGEIGKVQRGEGAENGMEGEDLKEKNGMTSKFRGAGREMEQFKRRETVRPRKDRAAALAYQLFHET